MNLGQKNQIVKKEVNAKVLTKIEGPKIFLAAPKMVSFSQVPAVKKKVMQLENLSVLLIS